MKYTPEMQSKVDGLNLKPENILYLTIARHYLRRIIEGTKKVEFRSLNEYYLKKMCNFDSQYQFISDKPITHLLLQGGYSFSSPRALVELKDWFFHDDEEYSETAGQMDEAVKAEAEAEGFTDDDEYLALVLGDVVYSE
ncbi:MAG TPA: hypothetical protein PLP88_12430 [Bacteroidales bacterium]|nr:hypothetical protein [Bacteroidales bacterium]